MPFENKYSLEDYDKAIELHKKGFGSLRISKILGYDTRSAIEDWINKGRKPYYFSEKRILACSSKENVERMRTMNKVTQPKAVKISAELRTKRLPKDAEVLNEDLAYIFGVIYGDRHVSVKQRRVILSVTDKDFALKFKETIERWSGFKARFFTRLIKLDESIKNRKVQYVSYIDSKEAANFLKDFDLNLLTYAKDEIKCAFVKGFFDSEGTVSKEKTGLSSSNININLIYLIRNLLNSLEIESKINVARTKPIKNYSGNKLIYVLHIYKMESILKYYFLIGFSIQRKQERLVKQIDYIQTRRKVTKMTEEKPRREEDRNTIFVGARPFMKSN